MKKRTALEGRVGTVVIFIYSRKSKWTGRGESVENQIAMCRDYIQRNIDGAGESDIIEYEEGDYSELKWEQKQTDLEYGQDR